MSDHVSQPGSNAPPATGAPASFEELLARLEAVVNILEDGQTGLAQSLARYEEGMQLLKLCYQQLAQAERRVEQLLEVEESGAPVTAPFEDRATVAPPTTNPGSDRPPKGAKNPRRGRGTAPPAADEGESLGTLF